MKIDEKTDLMKNLESYNKKKTELDKIETKIISAIKLKIKAIKENNYVKKISSNPTIFTIKLSNLGSNWDVRSHSNESLADTVINKIESANNLQSIIKILSEIKENKFLMIGKEKIRCNDFFLKEISMILEELA